MPCVAIEQAGTEPRLDLLDGAAERRLRHAQFQRRVAEAGGRFELQESLKLRKGQSLVHGDPVKPIALAGSVKSNRADYAAHIESYHHGH
jgi:hypothetical protein